MPVASHITWSYMPQGDRSLLIRFSKQEIVEHDIGLLCMQAAHALRHSALPGIVDIVPSFNTVALHHLPGQLSQAGLQEHVDQVLRHAFAHAKAAHHTHTIDIPVCYGHEYGPDLDELAAQLMRSPAELIQLHSQDPVLVFMVGFAPGAPYMGVHAPELDVPRRPTPRTHIAAGSVAIANRQSIIYPNTSPGGWHVIGRTPLRLFQPAHTPPALVAPGDQVRFIPISQEEFINWPVTP